MPIKIDYTTPASGATTGYHVVQQVSLDYANGRSSAQLASYVSDETYAAGKQPVFQQPIEFPVLPASGDDVLTFVEGKIIAPATDTLSPTPARQAFAGGTIV
ncbi:hypothetical protein OVY01_00115 [Robbsia sp. Bb-Pol-6]|uniref:Uncharacterized protein n=1 Tax=Robbsia betulipollinis TaxID=2981849 RepID=A0ABT3ZGL8_9BURK|nr:hypothetical protein [Robbsia betulipollinis]MCY0385669.1 hypothetical protein [Robbsia betulipollinis]